MPPSKRAFTPLRLDHDYRASGEKETRLTSVRSSLPQVGSPSPGTAAEPLRGSPAARLQKFHEEADRLKLREVLRSCSAPASSQPVDQQPTETPKKETIEELKEDPTIARPHRDSALANRISVSPEDAKPSIAPATPPSAGLVGLTAEHLRLARTRARPSAFATPPSKIFTATASPDVDRSKADRLPVGSEAMASASFRVSADGRKPTRYENRNPMSTIQCRNGPHCRKFLEGTCNYNHDFGAIVSNGLNSTFVPAARLNVESPAFTPKTGNAQLAKVGISPKAASAATFTPRGSGSVTPAAHSHSKESSLDFLQQQNFQTAGQFQEFVPGQSFLTSPQIESQPQLQQLNAFSDPFLTQQTLAGLDPGQSQINPYAQPASAVGGQPFFQDASSYKHPLNYHLYASIGPKREKLMAYQRSTADFFIPDDLREDLQRKSEATLQTFANSTLPIQVDHFHSLVALDTNNTKGQATFGYPSWIYKATSSHDGHTFALRRIEGFRLTSEAAIKTIHPWKRIKNASLVQIHEAFTTRSFGDSSLIIVTEYHPRAQTLTEKHFAAGRHPHRPAGQITPESDLWGYIVQLASALKTIHDAGLAAQTVVASKVLITSKNRLRLNGCGVLDITQHEQRRPVHELQRKDIQDLGRLILSIAARNPTAHHNPVKALELVSRSYSERLRSCLAWLVAPPPDQQDASLTEGSAGSKAYNIDTLLNSIADKVLVTFDSALHMEDEVNSHLMRELENGRLVRLLTKLNVILERPETSSTPGATTNPALMNQPSSAWCETGDRYYLKLFRDYVFHQVDREGRPVLDLGHQITCLNKLDAGIEENLQLVSRDEQSQLITTYKDVKRGFEAAWAEISKASNPSRR